MKVKDSLLTYKCMNCNKSYKKKFVKDLSKRLVHIKALKQALDYGLILKRSAYGNRIQSRSMVEILHRHEHRINRKVQ